jgi:hypothetical protein
MGSNPVPGRGGLSASAATRTTKVPPRSCTRLCPHPLTAWPQSVTKPVHRELGAELRSMKEWKCHGAQGGGHVAWRCDTVPRVTGLGLKLTEGCHRPGVQVRVNLLPNVAGDRPRVRCMTVYLAHAATRAGDAARRVSRHVASPPGQDLRFESSRCDSRSRTVRLRWIVFWT